ncbi:MAG: hypothetical protein LDLANPLL_00136 [Turneriella sp.]|nr:hypothetical protein [Turneriella sp.]
MRYELRQEFPYPLDTVLQARNQRFEYIERQPGLNSQELLSIEEKGPLIITRRRLRFGSTIPDIVKKMVPEKMLEMVDTNVFNTETYLSKFTMESEYIPDKIKITAVCPYTVVTPVSSVREYTVMVDVKVPIVANSIAKAIASSHREALVKDHEILLEICAKLANK